MKGEAKMSKSKKITEIADQGIIMPDGCRLSARAWIPCDAENVPVPAILEFLPYRKRDGTVARDCLTHPYFAKRGYACIRVDMRGNGDSEGLMEDEYTQQELDDGVSIINWLANQTWCTGAVGMMGISWGGFNALQVASLNPPALKAIITLCSTVDRYADDIHYKGGCLLNENFGWGATMWAYSSRAPDPVIVGSGWRKMWLERLEAEPFLPHIWLNHQNRDAYWKHGSICENYSSIKAATLAIGGWGDAYKNTVSYLLENISAPVKGIVGPWVHKYPHFAVPEPRIGFLQEAMRWWDHWLKGVDQGVEDDPDYTAYLMDGVRPKTWYEKRSGQWIAENNWPRGLINQNWYLQDKQTLGTSPEKLQCTISSPQTCGLSGGEYCAIWLGAEMPGDQRADDSLSACFTSGKLDKGLDIVGAPKLMLRLSVDKPAAQIIVRLNHIHPDGAATRITYGVLNLAHRDGFEVSKPMTPDKEVEVSIPLDQIAYRVPKGHHIRISISSSYWPLLWPVPHAVTIQLITGKLNLPTRPSGNKNERHFAEHASEAMWDTSVIRAPSNSRKQSANIKSGLVTLEIIDDFGSVRDNDHGLINGSIARECWSIHPDDPLSAEAKTHWTTQSGRDDWSIRTETYATMKSDASKFYLTARLEAYENDKLLYEKDFEDVIPRDCR